MYNFARLLTDKVIYCLIMVNALLHASKQLTKLGWKNVEFINIYILLTFCLKSKYQTSIPNTLTSYTNFSNPRKIPCGKKDGGDWLLLLFLSSAKLTQKVFCFTLWHFWNEPTWIRCWKKRLAFFVWYFWEAWDLGSWGCIVN